MLGSIQIFCRIRLTENVRWINKWVLIEIINTNRNKEKLMRSKLNIMSDIILLLPNTDRLQQVEDYVRGCSTSTKYVPQASSENDWYLTLWCWRFPSIVLYCTHQVLDYIFPLFVFFRSVVVLSVLPWFTESDFLHLYSMS